MISVRGVCPSVRVRSRWWITSGGGAKAVFERRVRVVDSQVVMDVNNALFKILSTN